MPFEEILTVCTSTPAREMDMEGEIGCLKTGARANLAVFKREKGVFEFSDVCGRSVAGKELLVPMMTIFEGDLVYRNFGSL